MFKSPLQLAIAAFVIKITVSAGEQCYNANEVYVECSYSCSPQTCDSIGQVYNCPVETSSNCEPACLCMSGYYRNAIGECISEEECEMCTGPYEYFSCGKACDNVCATLNKQNQTNCPIVNIQCNSMCYCEAGYARDSSNTCIPIDECPPPQCADDEVYSECPETFCEPLTCDQIGFPVNCYISDTDTCPGEPACICDNGNVRDQTGRCVSKDQCPSCGGDENAITGCSNYCGQKCTDYGQIELCPLFCLENGCSCKNGYLYDENIQKCVPSCECS